MGSRTPRTQRQKSVGRIRISPRCQYIRLTHNRLASRLGMVSWCNLGMRIDLAEWTRTGAHIRLSPLILVQFATERRVWQIIAIIFTVLHPITLLITIFVTQFASKRQGRIRLSDDEVAQQGQVPGGHEIQADWT